MKGEYLIKMKTNSFKWDNEARPSRVLPSGVPVFDRDSFFGTRSYIGVPYEPTVVKVDRLLVWHGDSVNELWRQNVLTFHGGPSDEDWIQLSNGMRVEDILKNVEKEIPIDALGVCNPGNHRLPLKDGKNEYTYIVGGNLTVSGGYQLRNDRVVVNWLPRREGRIYIKDDRKFHVEERI